MQVLVSQSGPAIVLGVSGRIDHANSEEFKTAFLSPLEKAVEASTPVIINLEGLEYISSAGLRVLMIASKTAKAKGGKLFLAGWSPVVKEIFTISRFNLVFDCSDTLAEALGKVAK
ncbi:MAG: STAS domain-containing protein [Magnetococcales bacterium]|nr:STAS domain-containing protein [Magnetococcales bacterium]